MQPGHYSVVINCSGGIHSLINSLAKSKSNCYIFVRKLAIHGFVFCNKIRVIHPLPSKCAFKRSIFMPRRVNHNTFCSISQSFKKLRLGSLCQHKMFWIMTYGFQCSSKLNRFLRRCHHSYHHFCTGILD